ATDREDEQSVGGAETRSFKPRRIGRLPALVVDPSRQLGDVVRDRVALDPSELAKVAYGVGGVAGPSPRSKEEHPATPHPRTAEQGNDAVDVFDREALEDRTGLSKETLRVHGVSEIGPGGHQPGGVGAQRVQDFTTGPRPL